jgi:hypothetical protein
MLSSHAIERHVQLLIAKRPRPLRSRQTRARRCVDLSTSARVTIPGHLTTCRYYRDGSEFLRRVSSLSVCLGIFRLDVFGPFHALLENDRRRIKGGVILLEG